MSNSQERGHRASGNGASTQEELQRKLRERAAYNRYCTVVFERISALFSQMDISIVAKVVHSKKDYLNFARCSKPYALIHYTEYNKVVLYELRDTKPFATPICMFVPEGETPPTISEITQKIVDALPQDPTESLEKDDFDFESWRAQFQ